MRLGGTGWKTDDARYYAADSSRGMRGEEEGGGDGEEDRKTRS